VAAAQSQHQKNLWQAQVAKAYDACADAYLEAKSDNALAPYLRRLLDRLPNSALIADLGCGAGYPIAYRMLQAGHQVIGADISRAQLLLAAERVPQMPSLEMDLLSPAFPDQAFDAVLSLYAIFHVPREQHRAILGRMRDMLKPGGYLLVTLGAGDWEGQDAFHGVSMRWSHYGPDTYLPMLQALGLRVCHQEVDVSAEERHLVVLAQRPA